MTDPKSAPSRLSSPPINAATNAGSTCRERLYGSRLVTAARRTPARAASAPPSPHAAAAARSGSMPMSEAARRFCAAPRIARPISVNLKNAKSAPDTPSPTKKRPMSP
jgi:hypothetical protein